MNCLTAFFFLLFLPLLSIDAQARLMPGMSLNDESIILNMGGRISSLPPPSSTISSPRPLMEIRRSSSSIFEMMFDVIGWITGGAPDPKAVETIEQQQVNDKSDQNDETAKQCDKLMIPSSNLILPPTLPTPRAMLLLPIPACPPIQSLVHPSPIMPSPTTPHVTPLPETIEQQQVNRKSDQNDETVEPCGKLMIPSSNLILPPTLPTPRAMLLSPIPACPPIQSLVHPSPIMPSPTTPHATPLPETIEQQQVNRKSDQNDETVEPCDKLMIPSSNLILPPTLPTPRAMLLSPIPACPPIQSLVHPSPIMPSPTTLHATPFPETIEQQQVNCKSDQNDETVEPCDKLIIPSSNLILPPTLPAPKAMLLSPIPACPPIQSLLHPSPIMPSPITPHATPLLEIIEQQQVNRKSDQNDETAKPCDKLMIPSSNLILPPTLPAPRAMLLSPIPTCPPIQSLVHPSPIMPSPTTPHATPLLETIEQQQVNRKSDQNDETAKPCDKITIPSSNLILPPTLPAPRAMLLSPIPACPPIQSLVHPSPIMPSPTTPHSTPLPANLFSPPKSAVPPHQNSVHPPPPIMTSPENKDQMIDGIGSTTSFGNSVISMITHPQNDNLQVS